MRGLESRGGGSTPPSPTCGYGVMEASRPPKPWAQDRYLVAVHIININNMNKEKEIPGTDFLSYMVKPHKKKSCEVTEKDLEQVIKDAHICYNLCYTQMGYIPGAYAIHHSQINNKRPLNFFVTNDRRVIINPVIISHTKVPVERIEGCNSFPMERPIKVMRFNKIIATYKTLTPEGKLSEVRTANLSGKEAEIWQHECGHANGILIYKIK